jgi:hypothetical protein
MKKDKYQVVIMHNFNCSGTEIKVEEFTATPKNVEMELYEILKHSKKSKYCLQKIEQIKEGKSWEQREEYLRENNLPVEFNSAYQGDGGQISLRKIEGDAFKTTNGIKVGDIIDRKEIVKIIPISINSTRETIETIPDRKELNWLPFARELNSFYVSCFWKELYGKKVIDGDYYLCIHDMKFWKAVKEGED